MNNNDDDDDDDDDDNFGWFVSPCNDRHVSKQNPTVVLFFFFSFQFLEPFFSLIFLGDKCSDLSFIVAWSFTKQAWSRCSVWS